MGAFKSAVTRRINQQRNTPCAPFWQRNYDEHSIRHDHALNNIRQYIHNNPIKWNNDQLHPQAPPHKFNQT